MVILVVEDEVIVGLALREEFHELGAQVMVEHDAEGALRLLSSISFDAAIIDIELPGMRGDELAKYCRYRFPHMPIVLATGLYEHEVRSSFSGDSNLKVLEKPHHFTALRACLEDLGMKFSRLDSVLDSE